jgi:hypothetical protein
VVVSAQVALADPLIDALGTDDPRALAAAITAIERAPTTPELADALFSAARACEDRLLDPPRALALYDRIVRELPEARVAAAAQRRRDRLRIDVGASGEHASKARDFAQLVAAADTLPADDVIRRANALARAPWPGAPDSALWLAEFLRRTGRFAQAQAQYGEIAQRWPASQHAIDAMRGGAGTAVDAHDWSLAETLARALPATDDTDRILRDDLLDAAHNGRVRDRFYLASWIAFVLAVVGLLASLIDAILRGGRRRPSARPPFEVLYIAPVAAVLIGVSFTGNLSVAPAVATIAITGLALSWLSGMTLDLIRTRGRPVRARATIHTLAVFIASISIGYVTMVRSGLLEMLVETVKFGPGA